MLNRFAYIIFQIDQMDKGTILSNATSYVKELQEKVKSLEAAGGSHRSVETVVLVRKPCCPVAPDVGESSARSRLAAGTPAIGNQLPEPGDRGKALGGQRHGKDPL